MDHGSNGIVRERHSLLLCDAQVSGKLREHRRLDLADHLRHLPDNLHPSPLLRDRLRPNLVQTSELPQSQASLRRILRKPGLQEARQTSLCDPFHFPLPATFHGHFSRLRRWYAIHLPNRLNLVRHNRKRHHSLLYKGKHRPLGKASNIQSVHNTLCFALFHDLQYVRARVKLQTRILPSRPSESFYWGLNSDCDCQLNFEDQGQYQAILRHEKLWKSPQV